MRLVDWLLPPACVVCGDPGPGLCARCRSSTRPAPLARPPQGLDAWYAAFAYEGAARQAVAALKFRGRRVAVAALGEAVHGAVPEEARFDAVTWVPTARDRVRGRGFDQAALLARAVAGHRRVPAARTLVRLDLGRQTGAGRGERSPGPVLRPLRVVPRRILVVDDVATTGATLRAAASALRDQGCESVIGATVARTLLKTPVPGPDKHCGEGRGE